MNVKLTVCNGDAEYIAATITPIETGRLEEWQRLTTKQPAPQEPTFRDMLLSRKPKWWAWPLLFVPWLCARVDKQTWKDIRDLLGMFLFGAAAYGLLVLILGVGPQ